MPGRKKGGGVKKSLSFLLRFGLSFGLLWFLFFRMTQDGKVSELLDLIRTTDVRYIVYAFMLFALIHGLLLLRWRIFIEALKLQVPWINMARYFFIGLFGNLFMPTAIGGDVIKAVGLCVNARQKPAIVASVLLDRLSGFASMVVVACFALVWGFSYLTNPVIWIMVCIMAFILTGLGCVLFNERLYRLFCSVFYFFPRVKKAVIQMHFDIALLKDRKSAIVKAIGVSCCSQLLLALTFFLLARALHQDVPLFYFIIFTPITCVASALPSIGGLGFREGMLEYLLMHIGVMSGIGVSIGLLDFLFMVVVGVLGWVFFMCTCNQRSVCH